MEYKMKGGGTLTEADFDRLGEACERGEYPGEPGEWVVRPQGRPPLCDEELVTVAFKIPRSRRDELDAAAAAQGTSRSQFLRRALERAIGA